VWLLNQKTALQEILCSFNSSGGADLRHVEESRAVEFKTAYTRQLTLCHCVKDRRVMCEFEGHDAETLRDAFDKIGLPTTAILPKLD
jgi:hypothetical protein